MIYFLDFRRLTAALYFHTIPRGKFSKKKLYSYKWNALKCLSNAYDCLLYTFKSMNKSNYRLAYFVVIFLWNDLHIKCKSSFISSNDDKSPSSHIYINTLTQTTSTISKECNRLWQYRKYFRFKYEGNVNTCSGSISETFHKYHCFVFHRNSTFIFIFSVCFLFF